MERCSHYMRHPWIIPVIIVLIVVLVQEASSERFPAGERSYVRCQVSGSMLSLKAFTVELSEVDGAFFIRKEEEPYQDKPKVITGRLPKDEYFRVWQWIKANGFWTLEDAEVEAEDAESYIFEIRQGRRYHKVSATAAGTLDNKSYYLLYQKLVALCDRYLPERGEGGVK